MLKISRRHLMGTAAMGAVALPRWARAQNGAARAPIDELLRSGVGSGKVPGVVAVAATDKGPFYEGAAGKRNIDTGPDMTVDSVFWIASMTKAVTTAAAMQMVEQGKLQLDQPAGDILPELKSPQVLEGFDASGNPQLRPAKGPVTLRQLLTHTAGYTYTTFDANTARYAKLKGIPGIITCKNDALKTPLAFDPGDRWQYGINIDFAGKMVEAVSGQRLESYFHEHLFGPLGMADTSFKLSPAQRARLVSVHQRGADGQLKPIQLEVPQEPEFFMGGGGLYSTASDYLKFAQAFLHDGKLNGAQILRPETVAEMSKNQIGDLNVTVLKTTDPSTSGDAEFFPGMVKKWGLGFMINPVEAPTGRGAGSLAWAGVANTFYWIDPRRRVAGVIMMQFLPFTDPQAIKLFSDFETNVYRAVQSA